MRRGLGRADRAPPGLRSLRPLGALPKSLERNFGIGRAALAGCRSEVGTELGGRCRITGSVARPGGFLPRGPTRLPKRPPPASQPASGLSRFRMLGTDSSYPGPEARPAAVVLACRRGTCKTEACLPPGSRGRAPASRPVSREPERYPEGARAGWGALAPGGCPPLGTGLPAATERPAGPEVRADRAAAAGRRGKSTGMESVNLRARVGRAGGRD